MDAARVGRPGRSRLSAGSRLALAIAVAAVVLPACTQDYQAEPGVSPDPTSSPSSPTLPEESSGASVSVNPKQVYLDQELVISGSGFLRYETSTVHIDLGDGLEPRLGSVDSNRCGDWALRLRPLGGGSGVTENIGEILDRRVVTLRALGAGGSQASVALNVLGAKKPVSKLGSPSSPFYRPPDGIPELRMWVQPAAVYLDQELIIRGSGFERNKPVVVYLYRREVVDIELGSVDSDQDGAWTLAFGPLDGESGVGRHSNEILPPGWRSFLNVTAEDEAGNVITSTPLQILGAETRMLKPALPRVSSLGLCGSTEESRS